MVRLGEIVAQELAVLAERDPRTWVIDGDLGDSYGVEAIAPVLGRRFVQAGIAEQAMVSLAAGLAAEGKRPWVFSFAAFLCCRAYDQIRICISQTALPVVLVGSHAGGCAGPNGKTHALMNDIALMSTLPAIEVWAPADAAETRAVVQRIAGASRPAYVRLPRDPQPALDWPGPPGGVARFGEPAAVAVVATGLGTQWAMRAREMLAADGIDVPVVHVPRIEPFPVAEVAATIGNASRLVAIEDHIEIGGLADALRRNFPDRRVRALGWPRGFAGASGKSERLRARVGLDDRRIAAACRTELEDRV